MLNKHIEVAGTSEVMHLSIDKIYNFPSDHVLHSIWDFYRTEYIALIFPLDYALHRTWEF